MPHPAYTTDRRAAVRRSVQTCCCRLLGEVSRGAELRDISPAGVKLLCEDPLQPGELLNLHLSGSSSRLGLGLRARVVHSEERPDGRWLAGCAFDASLP